jgi:hypothetical protein
MGSKLMAKRSTKKRRAKRTSQKAEKRKILLALGAGHGSSKLRQRLFEIESDEYAGRGLSPLSKQRRGKRRTHLHKKDFPLGM